MQNPRTSLHGQRCYRPQELTSLCTCGDVPFTQMERFHILEDCLTSGEKSLVYSSVSEIAQSCPTLCDPMGCSLPGSSVHGIFQARILEWVAISFFMRSSLTQGLNPGFPHCRQTLYHLSHQGSLVFSPSV